MASQIIPTRGAAFRASYLSHSPQETENLAAALAPALRAGDLLPLLGGLGAGKTCFARGLARGLGVKGEVASPSFTYLREHQAGRTGGLELYHFDCYRLHSADEWYDLGFADYLEREGVLLIEWPLRVLEVLPPCLLSLELQAGDTSNTRILELRLSQDLPRERRNAIAEALSPFPQLK